MDSCTAIGLTARRLAFTATVMASYADAANAQGPPPPHVYPTEIYVDVALPPSSPQDGMSWATAYHSLQPAIDAAGPNGQVWVAEGRYYSPNQATGFNIAKPLQLYGGFHNGDPSVGGRTGSADSTILDGKLGAPNAASGYHVITIGVLPSSQVVIDGFKIWNGNAAPSVNPIQDGGGIYAPCADLLLSNVSLSQNYAVRGGAIYFGGGCPPVPIDPEQSPAVTVSTPRRLRMKNCTLQENTCGMGKGGGIYAVGVFGEIVNTVFDRNIAQQEGGGVFLTSQGVSNRLDFTNCLWYKNAVLQGTSRGGGLALEPGIDGIGGNVLLMNCTLYQNSGGPNPNPGEGALLIGSNSTCVIGNSIIWGNTGTTGFFGNPTINRSCLQSFWLGTDPNFFPPDPILGGGPYGVGPTHNAMGTPSPCIDRANYDLLPHDNLDVNGDYDTAQSIPTDAARLARARDDPAVTPDNGVGAVTFLDVGAYEYQP